MTAKLVIEIDTRKATEFATKAKADLLAMKPESEVTADDVQKIAAAAVSMIELRSRPSEPAD